MAGTWRPLRRQPAFCASTMLLLTDGRIMCQQKNGRQWWALSPDQFGSYTGGAWSQLSSMRLARLYYASAVLADGRVFVCGGEYNGGADEVELNAAEIYDPRTDKWSDLPTPEGWTEMGDAASCMLADGRVLVGDLTGTRTATFTPGPDAWTPAPDKNGRSNEESWALLPDGTVLTVECFSSPKAEKFVPVADAWLSAGQTPSTLVEAASNEIGPAVVLTDGRCFFVGATGKTALYSAPPVASDVGQWVNGPDFPNTDKTQLGAKDAPACLLPNGRVLCTVGPVDGKQDSYLTPTSFFEFDGQQLNRVPDPPNNGGAPFDGPLLVVPSGQALYSAGSPEIYAYTPDSGPQDAWRPSIVDCPDSVSAGSSFTLSGRQLNGLSQASMYGDDASAATNYPLVRITTASGRIVFCTTSNHSTMAIATGAQLVTTSVAVPADIENGLAQLIVVANGVASEPREVLITGGRAAARGRSKFSPVASHPMAESRHATASRGILGAIGLGIRYIPCALYYACNWAAQLTCTESETSAYAQCAKTEA